MTQITLPSNHIPYTKGAGWCAPVQKLHNGKNIDFVFEISLVPITWGPALDKFGHLGMSIDLTEKQQVKEELNSLYGATREAIPESWTRSYEEPKKKPILIKDIVFSEVWGEDYPNSLFLKIWEGKDKCFTKCFLITENGPLEMAPEEILQGSIVSVKFKVTISCVFNTLTKSATIGFQNKLTQVKVLEQGVGQRVEVNEEEAAFLEQKKQKMETLQQ